jgi:hypothetical protein
VALIIPVSRVRFSKLSLRSDFFPASLSKIARIVLLMTSEVSFADCAIVLVRCINVLVFG